MVKASLLAILTILAPIPVGGYESWLLPVITLLGGLALLVDLSAGSTHRDGTQVAWAGYWLIIAGYGVLQTIGLYFLRDVSFYLPSVDVGNVYSVVDIERALQFMLRFTIYTIIVFVISRLRRRELDLVMVAVIVSASFQSLYGLVNYAQGNPSILGIWAHGMHTDSVMGTFYSRNQLAGYLAVALPLGLGWLWHCFVEVDSRGRRALIVALTIFYALLLSVALLGSGSRLGLTATVAGLLFWVLYGRRSQHARTVSGVRVFLWVGVALVVFALLWFGPDVVIKRFLDLSREDDRFAIWNTMLSMPFSVWLWGIGPGQFIDVFKLYQGADIPQTYWRALNDYLQFVLEYGIAGTVVSLVAVGWWLKRVWPLKPGGMHSAALAGVVAVLIHSVGDFDLRVPGTAVLFWIAVGITLRTRSR